MVLFDCCSLILVHAFFYVCQAGEQNVFESVNIKKYGLKQIQINILDENMLSILEMMTSIMAQ